MIEVSGGRAGPHEPGWIMAGYQREEIEPLRQQLLSQNDYFQVQTAMQKLGIHIKRNMLRQVKRYMFDSYGIGFLYENYMAWRRLATRKGLLGDASYLIHEITEVEELQRIQSQTGFKFMGPKKFSRLSRLERRRWEFDFEQYYLLAHSKALEAEYEFVAAQVSEVTNQRVRLSKYEVAAIDPTREQEAWERLLVSGIPMQEHYSFKVWRARADDTVPVNQVVQERLGYYLPTIRLSQLILYLKNIPLL